MFFTPREISNCILLVSSCIVLDRIFKSNIMKYSEREQGEIHDTLRRWCWLVYIEII